MFNPSIHFPPRRPSFPAATTETPNVSSVSNVPNPILRSVEYFVKYGAIVSDISKCRKLTIKIVTMTAVTGAPAKYNPQNINWAEPAYTSTDSKNTSNTDMPDAIPTTPNARPMLIYPSNVGTQSFIPCIKVSGVNGLCSICSKMYNS